MYRDGIEIHSEHGGDLQATNNTMELTAALMALRWFADRAVIEPVRLLCDSQYVVRGCNEWRHGWKRKGWRRGVEKELANADLWRDLDEALTLVPISLEWVKGHDRRTGFAPQPLEPAISQTAQSLHRTPCGQHGRKQGTFLAGWGALRAG